MSASHQAVDESIAQSHHVTLAINAADVVVAPFLGLGIQWDPFEYPPSEANWRLILHRVDHCRPGYLRVMINFADYCTGIGVDGVPEYVWNDSAATAANFSQVIAILDYAQARGIDVILGEWYPPRRRLPGGQTDPLWPVAIVDLLEYLRHTRGYTVVRYYNVINEPNGDWSGNKDFPTWAANIRGLHTELIARGLDKVVAIVGPDATVSSEWQESLDWLDWTVRDLSREIGAWDLHWYALDHEIFDATFERILIDKRRAIETGDPEGETKTRFLCESGILTGKTNGDQQLRVRDFKYGVMMADYVAQVARSGWQGALAWSLDDAMHAVSGGHRPDPPDELTLKVWGFWNTQAQRMGNPADLDIRPWFYTWSLMSRLFPAGSTIVRTDVLGTPTALTRFRAVAALTHSGDNVSVMLVNNDDVRRTVSIRLDGIDGTRQLTSYRYFDGERTVDGSGFPIPSGRIDSANLSTGIEVSLPERGVVFLTSMKIS